VTEATPGQDPEQPHAPPEALTLKEALTLYESTHLTTLKEPGTTRSRFKHLAHLVERTLSSLTVVELQHLYNKVAVRSPAAAYNGIKSLRHLYRKMVELQVYEGFNPATYVRVKRPPSRGVYLNGQELAALWKVLACYPIEDRLYFTWLITVFCRSGELRAAKVKDVTFWIDTHSQQQRSLWRKGRTKNGQHHEVPLPPQLTEELRTYLQTRPRPFKDSPWIFPGSSGQPRSQVAWWQRWNEIRSAAGLDHVHIHDLRRTGSTWAVETTGDLNTVSRDGLQHRISEPRASTCNRWGPKPCRCIPSTNKPYGPSGRPPCLPRIGCLSRCRHKKSAQARTSRMMRPVLKTT